MATFRGDFEDLHRLVANAGTAGYWRELPNGHIQFRSVGGAVLNWWPTTGTITVQGKPAAVDELKLSLAALVIGRRKSCTAQAALARPRAVSPHHRDRLPSDRVR